MEKYQKQATRTTRCKGLKEDLAVYGLGLTGEAGEVADLIKKHVGHGHSLSLPKLAEELGDVLWYISAIASRLSLSLQDIADRNIEKLQKRYPNGFSVDRSLNREI